MFLCARVGIIGFALASGESSIRPEARNLSTLSWWNDPDFMLPRVLIIKQVIHGILQQQLSKVPKAAESIQQKQWYEWLKKLAKYGIQIIRGPYGLVNPFVKLVDSVWTMIHRALLLPVHFIEFINHITNPDEEDFSRVYKGVW